MKIDELMKMGDLIDENGFKSSKNREEIVKIFASRDYESLINDFENSISTFPDKKKYPNYSFIYYVSLVSISLDNIEDIANLLKGKKTYKYLISGLKMLVGGKSKTLSYHIELADKNFDNKYEYINRCIFSLPYWENSALIFLLKVIYLVNKKDFFMLLEQDKSNFLFLIFFSERENIECNEENIVKFLNSNDELKAYSVVCYLMRDLNRNYREYKENKDSEEIKEKLNVRCEKVCELIGMVSKDKMVKMILDYIIAEDIYPYQFINMITAPDVKEELIKSIQSIKLNRIETLISMQSILQSNYDDINEYIAKFLMDKLYQFIKDNSGIYDNFKFEQFISKVSKNELISLDELVQEVIKELRISEFDRQIRYVQFNKDIKRYEELKEYSKITRNYINKFAN
ncbi:hypothetical protein [Paraclostridium sordellii]|uniref:hypothetical protein n=1 Tax=Paraclostridium sordellii TaxID=1505 RepID=UPI0005E25726|nr:hypothetical protein [Paeniclostridium sordellii]CEN23968.1 Uncharacterised protein [[Clostridium] sordellii] [Paeniclostridium sordellii]